MWAKKKKKRKFNVSKDCQLEVISFLKVMEYVKERASLYELTKTVKAWERKVEIAEVSELGVSCNL